MNTTVDYFENEDFALWWEKVDAVVLDTMEPVYVAFDEGPILDLLVDLYNEGCPVPDAANEAIDAYAIGQAEIEMGIPSWA